MQPKHEQLPSGKTIIRNFAKDGSLLEETHAYGILDIAIKYDFKAGSKLAETYFCKRRIVSRKTYEKTRIAYPDMPAADTTIEDFGSGLMHDLRKQQLQNKTEAERRLAESAESQFPRPESTNWLRVISGAKAHLVVFASRDWKVLSNERTIPMGREWLCEFGFDGTRGGDGTASSVAKGVEIGYEVTGKRI